MGKFEFIKTKNIVPVAKKIKLQYEEDYRGEVKEIEIKVYPYTVGEKLELQNLYKQIEELKDQLKNDNDPKLIELYEDLTYRSAFFILKKNDPTLVEEDMKKFPKEWLQPLTYKVLEFEGIDEETIKERTKKAINEAQI